MPNSPIVLALLALTLGICLLAFWKGSSAERIGSALILGNMALRIVGGSLLPPNIEPVIGLVLDGLTAMGLLAVTLLYTSLWLGGAMLLYAAQFTLHSFYLVTSRPNDLLHATVNNVVFLGVSACLAIGTVVAWKRRPAMVHT